MLLSLHIRNFLLIKNAYLSFNQKFTVITGETGSGKSLIFDSLLFALGNNPGKIVSENDDQAIVEVEFDVSANEKVQKLLTDENIEFNNLITIKRTIDNKAKIKSYIKSSSVNSSFLKNISKNLIEIHAQGSQQSLFYNSSYLKIVDNFAKLDISKQNLNLYYKKHSNAIYKYNEL
jgi:DNA repair protein RecN (Recombination protein N)